MIKTKLFGIVAASVLTGGIFSAIPSKPAQAQTRDDALTIIKFCAMAHKKFLQGDGGRYLHNGMSQLTESSRPVVALTCAAYGEGYDDGQRRLS